MVLIADDHPIFRRGLKEVIESAGGFQVVAEASNGEQAIQRIEEFHPPVALLDVDMPLMNGFDTARAVQKKQLPTYIIFLTMHTEEDLFNEAMDLGVRGYVLKENAANDILESIRVVAAGGYYISPHISQYLIARNNRTKSFTKKTPGLDQLTSTERRILSLIAENNTSKEIAEKLFISYKTVENHRTNIAKKLDLRGSHRLLKFALENKAML